MRGTHEGDNPPEECPKCHQKGYLKNGVQEKSVCRHKDREKPAEALPVSHRQETSIHIFASVAKSGIRADCRIVPQDRGKRKSMQLWFKALGMLGDKHRKTLRLPRSGRNYEDDMYERMAKDADEEGFHELAEQFRGVA